MTQAGPFRYRAFISYSSRDRLVGERFQTAIERYKIPAPLRGRVTEMGVVPVRTVPIFRDRSDLVASDDLGERILAGLVASRSLIVLCSPFSAASRWVNEEIKKFKTMGRERQIIAVLVSGEPQAFDAVTSPGGAFPPALLRRFDSAGNPTGESAPEPFAPDLREMAADGRGGDGFEFAKLKVIAQLIGAPLAELTQRQREVERRERRMIQGVAIAMMGLAAAATAGGWLAWRQTLEANARLDQTIDMAARQVTAASTYENRYGVSSAVIKEMLRSAQGDFSGLMQNASGTPRLALQSARLRLSFADAFEDAGDREGHQKRALAEAERELAPLEQRQANLMERIGLSTAPSAEDAAWVRLRLIGAEARARAGAGDPDGARRGIEARLAFAKLWAERTGNAAWHREVAISHLRAGNFHYEEGQPERSKAAFLEGLASIERLLAGGDHGKYGEDLLRGVTDLAQLLSESGEHRLALEQQQRAEAISRRLVLERPNDTEVKLGLVMVLTRLGDAVLNISGDQHQALASYLEAEGNARSLMASDPLRIDWQRALYIVLERAGSAHFQLGDIARAEAAFKSALEIVEALSRQGPDDPRRLYDTGVMQERMGQLRLAQAAAIPSEADRLGLLRQAADHLERLVTIREHGVAQNKGGKIQQYHLAVAQLTLGDVRAVLPDEEPRGLALFDRAQSLLGDLTQGAETRLEWFRTLAAVHVKRAQTHQRAARRSAALGEFERALAVIRDLRKREPDNSRYPEDEAELQQQIVALRGNP